MRLRDAIEQSVLAEELGFDSVFMTEHHFSRHGIVPDNLSMLSCLAAQTRRIRLGMAVSVLPLHDPVLLAESAALCDVLSDGRLEFGIGAVTSGESSTASDYPWTSARRASRSPSP